MQLYHLISGQVSIISIIYLILKFSDNYHIHSILHSITLIPWIRVGDIKGIILALVFLNFLLSFCLECVASQLSSSKATKSYAKTVKKIKSRLFTNTVVLFTQLITAYIFNMLNLRTYNIFILGFILSAFNILGMLIGIKTAETFGYFGFFLCMMIIALHTFVMDADKVYSYLLMQFNRFS